jgi:hypothetical protein
MSPLWDIRVTADELSGIADASETAELAEVVTAAEGEASAVAVESELPQAAASRAAAARGTAIRVVRHAKAIFPV